MLTYVHAFWNHIVVVSYGGVLTEIDVTPEVNFIFCQPENKSSTFILNIYQQSFEVGCHWPLWRGWNKRTTMQDRQKSNAKKDQHANYITFSSLYMLYADNCINKVCFVPKTPQINQYLHVISSYKSQ